MSTDLRTDRDKRRMLGVYYTPKHVSDVLVRWANPDGGGRILDPSFGGCSFLQSACDLATRSELVRGVDVDRDAFSHAERLLAERLEPYQLVKRNFFVVTPDDLDGQFDVIVGNPPYIRHHMLGPVQQAIARSTLKAAQISLPLTSDYWAYFLAHSLSFLADGGRLCYVLPGSALYADYSRSLIEQMSARFKHLSLVRLRERIFEGTIEQSIVLAASGHREGSCKATHSTVQSIADLSRYLDRLSEGHLRGSESWYEDLLSQRCSRVWRRLSESPRSEKLGDLFEVRIGTVTGANNFFVRTFEETLTTPFASCQSIPVVSRVRDLGGPIHSERDVRLLQESGRSCMLVLIPADETQHPERLF